MQLDIFNDIKQFITQKLTNTRNKNVFLGGISFAGVRVLSAILNYFQIGFVVRYLTPGSFGLWASVASVSSVFAMFNFGFGSSLLNKLSKLYAENNPEKSREYFFSIFYAFACFTFFIIILVFFIKSILPWQTLLKTTNPEIVSTGSSLFIVFSILTIISIPISLSDLVYYSKQESWWVSYFALLLSLLLLISSYLLVQAKSSFLVIVLSLAVMPLITSLLSFLVMMIRNKWLPIKFHFASIYEKVKELFNQSIQFLFIQIPTLILLSVDTIIVSKTAGLESAGDYFIIKKIVYLFAVIYLALFSSLWSSYTEAMHINDFRWIKKMLFISGILTLAAYIVFISCLLFFGQSFILLWTGKHISSKYLLFLLGLWSLMHSWGSVYSIFLNSIGKLKLQAILLTVGTVLLFPLSSLLATHYGIYGVCWSWLIVSGILCVSNPIQAYLYIKKKESEK